MCTHTYNTQAHETDWRTVKHNGQVSYNYADITRVDPDEVRLYVLFSCMFSCMFSLTHACIYTHHYTYTPLYTPLLQHAKGHSPVEPSRH